MGRQDLCHRRPDLLTLLPIRRLDSRGKFGELPGPGLLVARTEPDPPRRRTGRSPNPRSRPSARPPDGPGATEPACGVSSRAIAGRPPRLHHLEILGRYSHSLRRDPPCTAYSACFDLIHPRRQIQVVGLAPASIVLEGRNRFSAEGHYHIASCPQFDPALAEGLFTVAWATPREMVERWPKATSRRTHSRHCWLEGPLHIPGRAGLR